jgi:translation initiation factor IF-3
MLKIELVPTLSQCIETVAKKEYDETVRQLLASGEQNRKLLGIAGLLKNFLETADFKKLRAESERYLVDGKHVKFTVYAQGRVPKYEIQIT